MNMRYIVLLLFLGMLILIDKKKEGKLLKFCLFRRKGFTSLKQTVSAYGYHYSIKEHLFLLFIVLILVTIASYLFDIVWENTLFLIFLASLMTPMIIVWSLYHSYQERQFSQITLFLQHFLAMFKLNPKTYQVLKDCKLIVAHPINTIIEQMLIKQEEGGNIHDTFSILLTEYPHFIVHNLTTFVETVEVHGTHHYLDGLDLIQEDIDDWIEDVYLYKKQQLQAKNRMLMLCGLSCVIALFAKNMLAQITFDHKGVVYQFSILFFFITVLITIFMAHRILNDDWIDKEEFVC